MRSYIKNPEKVARIATIATLSFMVCWGLVTVVMQIKPFWVDEWRVIYNLKFKTASTIWGPLDYMQQFPRVYIELIKAFSSRFDYSYFTLRLPSYLVGTFTIFFSYRLMNKIYRPGHLNRFLFVMILISCGTFTGYFVQVKQYTMDILLSLVALWQLISLLELNEKPNKKQYILLCATFLIVPFFSYTYPLAIAPVYAVIMIQSIFLLKRNNDNPNKRSILLLKWFPLLLCAISIAAFYMVDVDQLLHDGNMRQFWQSLLMPNGFDWRSFFINCYMLFAEIGSGFVYWCIFGVLGIISFAYAIRDSIKDLYTNKQDTASFLRLYSVVLLLLVIVLYASGKFPLGEPRLNVFTVPAISILIIHFLDRFSEGKSKLNFAKVISLVLYAGLIGNIFTTFIADITGPVYARKMDVYKSTETAIIMAQEKKLPIFITPGVAYPYDKTQNLPFKTTIPGDWVLKTFPAYKVNEHLPVYAINDIKKLKEAIDQLPPYITEAVVGDGRTFQIIQR